MIIDFRDVLTDDNFELFAAKHYRNPACAGGDAEFKEDLKRIKYIKKLITRYISTGELKERLILNHIIVLSNVFLPEPLCRILYLKMEKQFPYIKPFLLMISMLTETIQNVKGHNSIETVNIPMDNDVIDKLRAIAPRKIQ